MATRVIIELEIAGNADTASEVVEGALDAGIIQDILTGYDTDGEPFKIVQAGSRLERDPEPLTLAPVVANPPFCPLRDGWALFDTGVGDMEVQREDDQDVFGDDDDARAHIRGCSSCLMALTVEADGLPVEPLLVPRADEDE